MPEDDAEDEWKFSVDEFDDSPPAGGDSSTGAHSTASAQSSAETTATDTDEDVSDPRAGENDDGNVAGEFAPKVPVVPEKPELENAAFVTLGAILTILVFYSMVAGASFGLLDVVLVVVIVGSLGAVTYGALVRLTPDT